ncbi:hypothetical protein CDV31_007807 [Fusarium ambrosium]|uniref:Uncharacterized protein n=1 Tax=Fusarium ambrosium TaxID=131363 RepID=A0A428U4P0_9HYPO|nr:hypothetical protein CDV31_007807 [Fusarium ambrosium]
MPSPAFRPDILKQLGLENWDMLRNQAETELTRRRYVWAQGAPGRVERYRENLRRQGAALFPDPLPQQSQQSPLRQPTPPVPSRNQRLVNAGRRVNYAESSLSGATGLTDDQEDLELEQYYDIQDPEEEALHAAWVNDDDVSMHDSEDDYHSEDSESASNQPNDEDDDMDEGCGEGAREEWSEDDQEVDEGDEGDEEMQLRAELEDLKDM